MRKQFFVLVRLGKSIALERIARNEIPKVGDSCPRARDRPWTVIKVFDPDDFTMTELAREMGFHRLQELFSTTLQY